MQTKARVIAFYLPQFYPIEENDKMWGKGFTEWTNVAKAKPLYKGHYQPQIPADLGFYDLRVPEVRVQQAEMAREHGVEGFCYWHYWFGQGRRVLERPFREVLSSGKPDYPFCLGWANHSWSNRTWQKSKHFTKEVTFIEQSYPGRDDYIKHFYEVLPAFQDTRYITVDDKPLFLVFDPEAIPDNEEFISLWQKLAAENGLTGIHFVARLSACDKLSFSHGLEYTSNITERYDNYLKQGYDAINSDMQMFAEISVSGVARRMLRGGMRKYFGNISTYRYNYDDIMKHFHHEIEKRE